MVNFRVANLATMTTQLARAGIEVEVDPEFYPNGRFARLSDPEKNPIQLWQPWGRDAGVEVAPEIDLFFRHLERFDAGVRSGDFTSMLEQFSDQAELLFEGVPVGTFRGREEIAAAYAMQPPDDEVLLLDEPVLADGTVSAPYCWKAERGTAAGAMHLSAADGRIARLVVTFE